MITFTTAKQITRYTSHEVQFEEFLEKFCTGLKASEYSGTIYLNFYINVSWNIVESVLELETTRKDGPFLEEHLDESSGPNKGFEMDIHELKEHNLITPLIELYNKLK